MKKKKSALYHHRVTRSLMEHFFCEFPQLLFQNYEKDFHLKTFPCFFYTNEIIILQLFEVRRKKMHSCFFF